MSRCFLACVVAAFVSCTMSMARGDEDDKSKKFQEGWEKEVPVFPYDQPSGSYLLKVQDGWLHVLRKTAAGVTEWHVVLARIIGADPPHVIATPALFQVSYGQRYFLRESYDILRCVRQQKEGAGGTFSLAEIQQRQQFVGNRGMGSRVINPPGGGMQKRVFTFQWVGDDWFQAAAGPEQDRMDCLVRLIPAALVASHGSIGGGGHLMASADGEQTGERWLLDDGEMLVVRRMLESEAKEQMQRAPQDLRILDPAVELLRN